MKKKSYILPQPTIIDLTNGETAKVEIQKRTHKFASDALASGKDSSNNPIFGTLSSVNNKMISNMDYGLPIFRFKRGQKPIVKFINKTGYTFNLHWHALNTTADVDGASTEVVFGVTTKIGTKINLNFPTINNNSALLWLHAHPMFTEINYIYAGLNGLVDIVDDESKSITDKFKYGDNRIIFKYQDIDLNSDGTFTSANLSTDENRSCFGAINGISCINWYSSVESAPYVDKLVHITSKNLVKIDILNATNSWRYIYLGLCDEKNNIKTFYQVQSDTGLMNPTLLTMISVAPASRVAFIFDISQFDDGVAHLFMYNFDLTEIFDTTPANPGDPKDSTLLGTIPDFTASENPTPYPTPIPTNGISPISQNQQGDSSALTYPIVPLIPQTTQVLENGSIIPPQVNGSPYTINKFLKIKWRPKSGINIVNSDSKDNKENNSVNREEKDNKECRSIIRVSRDSKDNTSEIDDNKSLEWIINQIKRVVFGETNYNKYKSLLMKDNFEYLPGVNYLSLLNKNYFYNLPDFDINTFAPNRNIILFSEGDENSEVPKDESNEGNPLGSTEYCDGANRIMSDMWNSDELDLKTAMVEYDRNPNNYKPTLLPTCLLRITEQTQEYSNIAMIGNNTLVVEFFDKTIGYNNIDKLDAKSIASAKIIFPPTPKTRPMNINQWIELVNETFKNTKITFSDDNVCKLSKLLALDWTFFPFKVSSLYDQVWYIKTVMMKVINKSKYHVRLLGHWPLLQFFGKSLTGDTIMGMNMSSSVISKSGDKNKSSNYTGKMENKIESKIELKATSINKHKTERIKDNRKCKKIKVDSIKVDNIKVDSIKVDCKNNGFNKFDSKDNGFNKVGRKDKETNEEKKQNNNLPLDMNIQTIFPKYATNNPEVQIPILHTNQNAEIIIPPEKIFKGFLDGFDNDNLMTFAVKVNSLEEFIYHNGDTTDAHPLHFHLTSGFSSISSPYTSPGLLRPSRNYASYLYSRDVYGIGPQQTIAFYLKFANYNSNESVLKPSVRGLGYQVHCHFAAHVSDNSMMNEYFVYDGDRADWF